MTNRTLAYYFTVPTYDCQKVDALRKQVQIHNARARLIELQTGKKQLRLRVKVRARLGKDSPFRHLYAVGGPLKRYFSQDIRPEHGERFDVYVNAAN
jgi:hypothetical protein